MKGVIMRVVSRWNQRELVSLRSQSAKINNLTQYNVELQPNFYSLELCEHFDEIHFTLHARVF